MSALRRLAVVLALAGAAGALIALAPRAEERGDLGFRGHSPDIPGWTVTDGAPEWALPVDTRQTSGIRLTYRRGAQTLWVSLALFTRQDDAGRRASVVYPEEGTSYIERADLPIRLLGEPETLVDVPILIGHKGERRLLMAYWHQLGRRAFGSQYTYRLELLREVLVDRTADAGLVRVAAALGPGAPLPRALGAVAEVAPHLHAATSRALSREVGAR
ncbi:MAG: exosortase-associated EpsI family protein [Candidatus Rokuibacteriota bacterium]